MVHNDGVYEAGFFVLNVLPTLEAKRSPKPVVSVIDLDQPACEPEIETSAAKHITSLYAKSRSS